MAATVDLHLHTLASDGRLSPTELIELLASRGLKTVAISDHDTTDGLAEAFQAAERFPDLRVIPAIELSTDLPGDEVHLLSYFLQPDDDEFQATLRHLREGRLERGRLMVEKLAALGMNIEWERVQEIAGDGSVGRPHVALALVEKGYFREPREAFVEHLCRNGLAYVEREKMSPEEGVRMLARVGGVSVLAHPAYMKNLEGSLESMKAAGLVGMEVYYSQYNPETIGYLAGVAKQFDLIPCGGSDYHGLGNSGELLPGYMGPPEETVERLEHAAERLRTSLA